MFIVEKGETEWFALNSRGATVFKSADFAEFAKWLTDMDIEFIVEEDYYDLFEMNYVVLLGLSIAA